ncbi:8290_t:CDS:2 [Dentiscutata erythropus]|uniref:8290_t:CDS:1 n=1 Tax=Dentiscutata erythropus TaxID=1348616 RepID=A0A9N9GF84_9GLOM|nr:8290_t:CDS:2 [Dentiscutata erythropus]
MSFSSDSLLKDVLLEFMRLMRVEMGITRKSLGDCDILGIHIQASVYRFIKLVYTNRRFTFVNAGKSTIARIIKFAILIDEIAIAMIEKF